MTRFKFIAGRRYRHHDCLDIDIYVCHCSYRDDKRSKLKIHYINRSGHFIIVSDAVTIYSKDYYKWKLIDIPINLY